MLNAPAFEIGLWNAWIFMLPHVATFPIFFRLAKGKESPDIQRAGLSKLMMSFCCLSKLIYFPAVVYSVFLPLQLKTAWFYTGLPIALIGLAVYAIFLVNWADTPPGKPVTSGLYRYTRHPMYISTSLLLLGVTVASASWVFLLITVITTVGEVVFAGHEEKGCLNQYGDAYREYMDRTSRWLGIPK
jgi:protein-S-isoprenylcysteine O-methyltransferase Ste14